jgi:hypothetical protein
MERKSVDGPCEQSKGGEMYKPRVFTYIDKKEYLFKG